MSMFLRSLTMSTALMGLAALMSPASAAPTLRPHATAQDLGPAAASETVTASLVLKVKAPAALEALAALQQTPGLPFYHQFLSTAEFADLFAPSQHEIRTIKDYLAGFGITVDEVYPNRLLIRATGSVDAFNAAFDVDVHAVSKSGKRFHRAHRKPRIPALLRDLLVAIEGVSNEDAQFRPHRKNAAELSPVLTPPPALPMDGAISTGQPGDFTVGDVADMYNINPLYDRGIDGSGRTIGIATLASFDPQDAYTYWDLIGLDVDQDRIEQVHVDGGGELSGPAGSGETCLDVEQSGGLAPGAKIVVYDAPNTDDGFTDLFYRAVSDNKVDSLSVSWGEAEEFYFEEVVGEDRTAQLHAFHQVFLEAGVQGISLFASAGDSGAYDINDAYNDPVANVLSVDSPASDPAITAAGGTTTPVTLSAGPGTPDLVVANERVWGWDYLENYLVQYVDPSFLHQLFPVGGGGGVSVYWGAPYYQQFVSGVRRTERNQSVVFDDGTGPVDLLDLPGHFSGRNLPDVSLDGDPETGFLVYSTEDGGLIDGDGGTSFVAPQLNGITALLSQASGERRIGFLNPSLYRYKATIHGAKSPLVDVSSGNNWFYTSVDGYDPGTGLGVLDVANLAAAVKKDRRR